MRKKQKARNKTRQRRVGRSSISGPALAAVDYEKLAAEIIRVNSSAAEFRRPSAAACIPAIVNGARPLQRLDRGSIESLKLKLRLWRETLSKVERLGRLPHVNHRDGYIHVATEGLREIVSDCEGAATVIDALEAMLYPDHHLIGLVRRWWAGNYGARRAAP